MGLNIPRLLVFSDAVYAAIVAAVLTEGFSREHAMAWADGWASRAEPTWVARHAVDFDRHGLPIREAIAWHQEGFDPLEACRLYDAQFSPRQASQVRKMTGNDEAALADWLATGLPGYLIVDYLKAGVAVSEVPEFERDPLGRDAALSLLAALRA